ncbi:uncharacterized protein LOC131621489 [Vicia villosa]|uniref:uncharacterized protein LOC131621489 n=1 Tax=Vicia villosa TaxID=3911 RepID=UPI00273AD85D|nr:uncharacterized protein LOC131621489 [Vicia villosa]
MKVTHGSEFFKETKSESRESCVLSRARAIPICHCGDDVVLHRVNTKKNFGKKFWGCHDYKGSEQRGCGFFKWFHEEFVEDKCQDLLNKLEILSKDFEKLKSRNEELGNVVTEIQGQLKPSTFLVTYFVYNVDMNKTQQIQYNK